MSMNQQPYDFYVLDDLFYTLSQKPTFTPFDKAVASVARTLADTTNRELRTITPHHLCSNVAFDQLSDEEQRTIRLIAASISSLPQSDKEHLAQSAYYYFYVYRQYMLTQQ